ncbi:MAG TPA: hypothetical protein PLA68_01060 [Panacibacter sp.]|nr:hypothetical protein [Panacibacter sp.]
MKKLFVIVLLAVSTCSFAQNSMKDDIDIIQSLYGKNKKDLVNEFMKLPETQAAAFWKIYDAYETERKELGKKKIQLINDYAANYETLTDEKADELAKASLKNNMGYEKLYSKYYGKIKKVTGAVNAAKFIQLETYIQTAIRSEVQDAIPFIGEIDRKKSH